MKKIIVALLMFVLAVGVVTPPASAATLRFSRSTDVSWGAGQVSVFAVSSSWDRVMGYVDDDAADGQCVTIQRRGNTQNLTNWLNVATSCGPLVRFDIQYHPLTTREWRIVRNGTTAYSTLR